MPYSMRVSKPAGANRHAWGGAARNMGLEALCGDTDMICAFDDFNGVVTSESFGDATNWETLGWVLTDVGVGVADTVAMNDPAVVAQYKPSCIRIFTGTADDAGGNMQLDRINGSLPASSGAGDFPHLWFPETAAGVTAVDYTTWVFACRIGFAADETGTGTDWDSKAFVGLAVAGDTGLMTAATGALTVAGAGEQLLGFHIPEDGSIDGISQRVGNTAYVEGTNFTELKAAGAVDNDAAGDIKWYDLAIRMDVGDWSEATNGTTTFYSREVASLPSTVAPGSRDKLPTTAGTNYQNDWRKHGTVLSNQVPLHTVSLVPTIEVINGPTAGLDGALYLDWWAFGTSRFSLK